MVKKRQSTALAAVAAMALAAASCGSVQTPPAPETPQAASGQFPALRQGKRGVSYSFEGATAGADMALLSPALVWFYNWGTMPRKVAEEAAQKHTVAFFPMVWNDVDQNAEVALRAYKSAHPECEYLLAFNEPNLTDQANMTPAQAAKKWPKVLKIAKELNLKIVSPAMNYGTLPDYGDPIVWLDEFFTKKGVSLDDVSAIAVHCYMPDAAALKMYVERFQKYGKPIWMTEFCAWENIASADAQREFMSEAVTYMELDPNVERYAWFIPKGREPVEAHPYMQLITKTRPPELTACGEVFASMTTCDRTVFVPAGERIEAERFSNCNLSQSIGVEGFSRPVHFRPTTDSGGVLDIYNFIPGKWVEYQVETAESRDYRLTLRYTAPETANLNIYIDGTAAKTAALGQNGNWAAAAVPLRLEAGKHVLRLEITGGSCALNWLKVE
jgi:hypothetical protein